jgi:serine/threonine-protein kinase RsbW
MEIKMVLDLPRDALSVPISRQVLDSCLETLGVTPDTRADIALALSEACANVIQHAGPGEEYEVLVSARNRRCAIEVVNTASRDAGPGLDVRPDAGQASDGSGDEQPGWLALADGPVPEFAEHGRGLKIIDAVTDNMRLMDDQRQGTTVHFEKMLQWLPGAPGQQLFAADGDATAPASQAR